MKILLVEDHPAVAQISCNLLREVYDHQVEHAGTGLAALASMETFRPELVLIDLNLPDMNGYEVAVRLRSEKKWDEVLLVALTGFGSEVDQQLAAASGIDSHFRKPMDFELLTQVKRQR